MQKKHFNQLNESFAKSHVKRYLQRRLQQMFATLTPKWKLVNVGLNMDGLPSLEFIHIECNKNFSLNTVSKTFFILREGIDFLL